MIGPILDSTGTAVTTAVIGDINITKNGTTAALAASATLTHSHNGNYVLALTTSNTDTLGRLDISSNNSAQSMPVFRYTVLTASTFDAIVTNAATAAGGLQDVVRIGGQSVTAAAGITFPSSIASPTNITAATGVTLAAVTHTGAVIPTVSAVTGLTAANLDVAVSTIPSLTQSGTVITGTADTGGSATSIPIKTLSITLSVTDQLKGRVILFKTNTATTALRGQGAPISGSTTTTISIAAGNALTTAPAVDDSFTIV